MKLSRKDKIVIFLIASTPIWAFLDWIMFGYNTLFGYLLVCAAEMLCFVVGYLFGKGKEMKVK